MNFAEKKKLEIIEKANDSLDSLDHIQSNLYDLAFNEGEQIGILKAIDAAENTETDEEIIPAIDALLTSLPARENKMIGQHWLEVAQERINAGEAEYDVLADYGWVRDAT